MYSHIVHLADIHIRTDRTEEYMIVFDKLFESIRKNTKNPLIVICGDVIHEKGKITPEVIRKTLYFLNNLANIGKTILINGNHDFIENNLNRDKFLDVIPKQDNLDYLTTSGHYDYDNVRVSISSLDDKVMTLYKHIDGDKLSIHLGHYTINEVSKFIKGRYSVEDHKGYDFALLGDIHNRGNYDNCYYSGSLIQQNHGESREKGYGIVDVETKKYKYVDIPNDYGFITIKTDDKGELIIPNDIPIHSNVRLCRSIEYEHKDKEYQDNIRSITNIISLKTMISGSTNVVDEIDSYDEIDDMTIISTITKDHPFRDEILSLHKKHRSDSQTINKDRSNFYLKRLEFNNIMNYKSLGVIDFEELNGIIGIHGNNATGKSNLMRIIIFALCGNISVDYAARDDKGKKSISSANQFGIKYSYDVDCVLNRSSTNGSTTIIFNYGNEDYKITRTLVKKSDGKIAGKVNLCKRREGVWISENSGTKIETDRAIHNMIGRSSLFILMNVYNRDSTSIVSCTPRERYNMIASLFDTEMFETISNRLSESIRNNKHKKSEIEGAMDYIKRQVQSDVSIDVKLLSEEENRIKADNKELRLAYTNDIDIEDEKGDKSEISFSKVKKLRQELKRAEKKIVSDLEKGVIESKVAMSEYDNVLSTYMTYKHYQKISEHKDMSIPNLPPACNTGITKDDVERLGNIVKSYDYDFDSIDKELLMKILNQNDIEYREISPEVMKISIDLSEVDKFKQLQKEVNSINVSLDKIKHTPEELDKLLNRYDSLKHTYNPNIKKLYSTTIPEPIDIEELQKELDELDIPVVKTVRINMTKEELQEKIKRYPSDIVFEKSKCSTPSKLPKTVENIEELEDKLDTIVVHPLRNISKKRKITISVEELKERANNIFDIDKIVKLLSTQGATKENIKMVSGMKDLLPKLSDIYKHINEVNDDINFNKKVDEDILFNKEQQKSSELRDKIKKKINDELYMRNKHIEYLEQLEMIKVSELVEHKKSLERAINDELYMRNRHTEHLEELEAHKKLNIQKKIDDHYNNKLVPMFEEMMRRITYVNKKQEYEDKYRGYLQNVAYLKELSDGYDKRMQSEAILRYFNRVYGEVILKNKTQLANINNTIEEKLLLNNKRLDEISELYKNNKQLEALDNKKEEMESIIKDITIESEYQKLLTKEGGVKNYILSKYLNSMEKSINNNLLNYRIEFKLEDKNIYLIIHKHNYKLTPQQLSGYESFSLELSTKQTLNKFSTVATSQLLMLDEGFDVIDNSNIEIFQQLIDSLIHKHYKHIIIISHNDMIKSLSSKVITPNSIREKK